MFWSVFRKAATFTSFLFLSGVAPAQFSLTGEFRPRTEVSHGYATLADENQDVSAFTSQRTRLNFNFSNEFIRTGIVLQDVRYWGNQRHVRPLPIPKGLTWRPLTSSLVDVRRAVGSGALERS